METRSLSLAGIVVVLKRAVNFDRSSFWRESSGTRRKWGTLAWVALFLLPLAGFQMQRSLALPGTLSAEVGGGGDAPLTCPPACGILFTVNSTGDGGDVAIGNGICADSHGNCTLRAAIQEANAQPTDDTISFDIPTSDPGFNGMSWIINLTTALPDLSTNLNIQGLGANLLTVQRDFTAPTEFRIFNVTTTGTVTLSGLTISNGKGLEGGAGISNAGGTVNVTNSTISGNFADVGGGGGGGIFNISGTLNVANSTITGNTGDPGAGILCSEGTVNVTDSTITGNNANYGIAVETTDGGTSTVNIIRSTVSDNFLGGIVDNTGNNNTSTLNVINSTVSGNPVGSGIFVSATTISSTTLNVTNSTISGNSTGSEGGGISNSFTNSIVNIKSSIVANNTGRSDSPDVFGPFTSHGFNLISKTDGSTGFPASTDQTGTVASPLDPKLDPAGLQNNGGPTQTIALQPGSLAIDKGDNANAARDQRNYIRSGTADVGAFEFGGTIPVTLANISTRLRVETGDNVLIGGFIITGTQPKKVIVRAIGPSLPLAGALADPVLELHGPGAFATITNDNWRSDQQAEIIATGIPPTNDLESAIVATLPANSSAYTAIVRGVSNRTGIGVVEAYDLDRTVDSKLANISTRGLVQTGDNILIGGLIVLGQDPQKVIVRAIGPSLSIPGKLADPTLELRDGNGGLIRSNDNWRTDQEAEIIATGIPPTNDLESAIVETLPANGASYTAIVRGVNGTTGVAVVEVYALN